MPSYSGSALFLQWTYASGTITPNTDYRTCTYTPGIDLYEETAGADATKSFIGGLKEGEVKIGMLMQAAGTAITNGFVEGTQGTLIIAPEGTASGKQKMTIPGIAMGCTWNIAYNQLTEIAATVKQVGNRTDGTY